MGGSAGTAMEWLENASAALADAQSLEEALDKTLAAASALSSSRQSCAFVERQGHVREPICLYRSIPAVPEMEMQRLAAQSDYSRCRQGRRVGDVHCFPLRARGRALGAILLQGAQIDADAEPALGALATLAAVVLDNLVLCRNEWTRLPNLSAIRPVLAETLKEAKGPVALFFIDIDDFKSVNSKVGYFGGAELLIQLAARLRESPALKTGWFGHISGDEFIYVLPMAAGEGEARAMDTAAALRQAVGSSFLVHGERLALTLSIGASLYPHDAHTLEELLAHADRAALGAKAAGKDTCRLFGRSTD
jgi:diguanylate cyclase (GGDEF)-like protein